MFPARINDRIRNDVAAECEQNNKACQQTESRCPKQTHYCDLLRPYQEVSNHDDYSSNGETAVLRDDLEMEIAVGDMRIRGSYAPDHFVSARCQRWDQGDTKCGAIGAI